MDFEADVVGDFGSSSLVTTMTVVVPFEEVVNADFVVELVEIEVEIEAETDEDVVLFADVLLVEGTVDDCD